MNIPYDKYFLTTREAAETLGIPEQLLIQYRTSAKYNHQFRNGPEPLMLGDRLSDIRYRLDEIVEPSETQTSWLTRFRQQQVDDFAAEDAVALAAPAVIPQEELEVDVELEEEDAIENDSDEDEEEIHQTPWIN